MKKLNNTPIDYKKLKQILKLACDVYPEDDEDGSTLYEKYQVNNTLKYIKDLEKGVNNNNFDVFEKLNDQGMATFEGVVNLNDEQKAKWDEFDLVLSVISDIAYEYDFNDAQMTLNDLAKEIDNFKIN